METVLLQGIFYLYPFSMVCGLILKPYCPSLGMRLAEMLEGLMYLYEVSYNNTHILFHPDKSKKRNKGHVLRWGSHEEGEKVL